MATASAVQSEIQHTNFCINTLSRAHIFVASIGKRWDLLEGHMGLLSADYVLEIVALIFKVSYAGGAGAAYCRLRKETFILENDQSMQLDPMVA